MSPSTPAGPVPVPTPVEPKKSAAKKKQQPKTKSKAQADSKPTKTLPNWRVGVAKQFDILRAYAAASSKGTKPVTIEEASEIVGMSPTTTITAHSFLTSVGLLRRTDSGSFLPSAEVLSFLSAYEWDRKAAAHKLAPRLRDTWFGTALLPRLAYGEALEENAAIGILAEAAGASPDYKKELRMLIEFMLIGGVVQREGNHIKQMRASIDGAPQPRVEEQKPPEGEPMPANNRINTSFISQSPGGFDFNIAVHVDMAEFGNWRPERIQAFFRGVAEVLAAKADVEKGGAGS